MNRDEKQLDIEMGDIRVEYTNYEIKSYSCKLCGVKTRQKNQMVFHIHNHGIREKLDRLIHEVGIDGESRINRMKKAQSLMENDNWEYELIETIKEKAVAEEKDKPQHVMPHTSGD